MSSISFYGITVGGNSVRLTKHFNVGVITTFDLFGVPLNDRSK